MPEVAVAVAADMVVDDVEVGSELEVKVVVAVSVSVAVRVEVDSEVDIVGMSDSAELLSVAELEASSVVVEIGAVDVDDADPSIVEGSPEVLVDIPVASPTMNS